MPHTPTRHLGPALICALLCGSFLGFYSFFLERLPYNIDEGVSILNARLIGLGMRPYVDFFYHQLPLHMLLLSLISPLSPDSLFLHRLPSLLAIAATGWVVYRIGRRMAPASTALMAVALFYFVPLQFHGLLAMPNGLMMFFSTLSVYLIVFREEQRWVILGSVCLVIAVLFKPLALATLAAIALTLFLQADQRRKLRPVMLIVALGGFSSWLLLHILSEGYFTEMLGLQLHRYTYKTFFERMTGFTAIHDRVPFLSLTSFFSWNLYSHAQAFSSANLGILVTALCGTWAVWGKAGSITRGDKRLLAWWLLFPLLFSLFVWEPAWMHYHIQYLPALSILGALFLQRLWSAEKFRVALRLAAVFWMALYVALGVLAVRANAADYGHVRELKPSARELLTFDPFLNFLTHTEPACGLTDPMAQTMPSFYRGKARFRRFIKTPGVIIECLEESPETQILISRRFTMFFIDGELHSYLSRLDEGRVIYLTQEDEAAFHGLFE